MNKDINPSANCVGLKNESLERMKRISCTESVIRGPNTLPRVVLIIQSRKAINFDTQLPMDSRFLRQLRQTMARQGA